MDLYDKKIAKLLIENCRYNLSDIAKAVNLSKDTVKYRIKRLENENLISNYSVLFNPRKFGYTVNHLLLKLKSIDLQKEKAILEKIINHKNVTFVSSQSGTYDLQIIFHIKTVFEKDRITTEFLNLFKNKVRDYKIVEHINDYNFSFLFDDVDIDISIKNKSDTSFSVQLNKVKDAAYKIPKEIAQFDETDKKIMKQLIINPQDKLTNIGNKIGMTSEGVKKRIRNIIEKEGILKFSLYPNHEKLGLFNYMLMFKIESLPTEVENKLKQFLIKNNFIVYAANMQGAYNLFVYILAKNPSEFNQRSKMLRNIIDDYIIDYDLSILTDIHKFVMISNDFLEN